jgi:membrane protease subunit HflK
MTMAKIQDVTAGEFREIPHLRGRLVVIALVIILFLIYMLTGWYTVGADEVGVVQRFGRYLETTEPGLRFKIPFGVDRVTQVKVRRQMKAEFGFRTVEAGVQSRFQGPQENQGLLDEALMVTGDLNMTVVEWIIQYRIGDPKLFLFRLREPEKTLRDVTESVMREVVGDRTVDETLTFGRQEIEMTAKAKLQTLVQNYEMGIQIEQVVLQGVTPPQKVEASFNEVNQAQQERERMINDARSNYNKAVPKASGEAQQKIQEAVGYSTQRVNEAMGNATRFNATLEAYLKAPEVTRRRMYLETMGEVIPRLGRKVVIDNDVKQFLPLLSVTPGEEAAK